MKQIYFFTILTVLGLNTLYSQNGNALNFDGIDDNVSTTLPAIFSDIQNTDISIEVWILPQSAIFSRIFFAQVSDTDFMNISYSAENNIIFYTDNLTSVKTADDSLILNEWNHITVTWDATIEESLIYINGELQSTVDGGASTQGFDNIMTIGAKTNETQFFNGTIDELRIWNSVRTETEINENMTNELSLPQPNLANYYKFNEGEANADNTGVTTLNDELAENNGTLSNFTLNGDTSNWVGGNVMILGVSSFFNNANAIQLFPNPSQGFIEISGLENTESYSIINALGAVVATNTISNLEKIDVSDLSNGIYLMKFEKGYTIKFIKK